jgi:hypothetical protein
MAFVVGMVSTPLEAPHWTLTLIGFSDSDYSGDSDDHKSMSGVIFFLGSSAITWNSHKQKTVALSSCDAPIKVKLHVDNMSAMALSLKYSNFFLPLLN